MCPLGALVSHVTKSGHEKFPIFFLLPPSSKLNHFPSLELPFQKTSLIKFDRGESVFVMTW